jgi:hypothetical protein
MILSGKYSNNWCEKPDRIKPGVITGKSVMNLALEGKMKARTQQIAWVACPAYDEQTIRACEAALIGHFAPHANRQQRKGSDSPEQVIPLLHTFHAIGVRR